MGQRPQKKCSLDRAVELNEQLPGKHWSSIGLVGADKPSPFIAFPFRTAHTFLRFLLCFYPHIHTLDAKCWSSPDGKPISMSRLAGRRPKSHQSAKNTEHELNEDNQIFIVEINERNKTGIVCLGAAHVRVCALSVCQHFPLYTLSVGPKTRFWLFGLAAQIDTKETISPISVRRTQCVSHHIRAFIAKRKTINDILVLAATQTSQSDTDDTFIKCWQLRSDVPARTHTQTHFAKNSSLRPQLLLLNINYNCIHIELDVYMHPWITCGPNAIK